MVELAALEGASLAEVTLGESEDSTAPSLAGPLAEALEGVDLPGETVARPKPKRVRVTPPTMTPAAPSRYPIRTVDLAGADLRVRIGSLELRNPVMPASGCFGWGLDYAEIFSPSLLGAVVTKGTTPKKRPGNAQYRIAETPSGILNSIGLENPGAEGVARSYAKQWRDIGAPVIVNVAGYSVEDYVFVVRTLADVPGVAAFELNVSCPNVEGGMLFGSDPALAAQVTEAVKAETDLPVIVKLTPNAPDILAVAAAIERAGADALTCINTVLGMRIDVGKGRPVLGTHSGGLSGPAIRPIAVHLTYQVAQHVSIPIIGAGGVTNARDALEFLMAGASAVQIGTATFADPLAPVRCIEGLAAYLRESGLGSIRDVVGVALPAHPSPEPETEYRSE
jgi:dihydroorotate dehydrogenase (NAD+) catalytic subunit